MSIVALKRKTAAMRNVSTGQKGFSINGTHRNQGYIGQTSLSRSLINTPHGQTGAPKGHGGCCGNFSTTPNICASETFSLEDNNVVKKSVLSSTGMLSNRNRWLKRSAPYTSTKQTGWTNSQGDYIAYLKKKAARGCDTIQTEIIENYINTYYIITDVAGNGIAGDNGSENWSSITRIPYPRDPLEAQLNAPSSVTVFNDQDTEIGATIYICDTGNFFIKMIEVDRDGKLTDFAGKRASSTGYPLQGSVPGPQDKLSMRLNIPTYVATDINGNVYIADPMNQMIYKITISDNQMDYIAGNGNTGAGQDNIAARSSVLNRPRAVLVDDQFNIYIADSGNNKIRFVNYETDVITTIINSSGAPGYQDGPAATALLRDPREMIFDSNGNLYFVDFGNNCIRFYNKTTQIVSTFLKRGYLFKPYGIALNPINNDLFISDIGTNQVFIVNQYNINTSFPPIKCIAGIVSINGGYNLPNSLKATEAIFNYPRGLFFDINKEQLLITDQNNNRIRSIKKYNENITKKKEFEKNKLFFSYYIIKDIAGTGISGDNGTGQWVGGLETVPLDPLDAQLKAPLFVSVFNNLDPFLGRTIYICDTGNFFIKMIKPERLNKLIDFAGNRDLLSRAPLQGSVPGPRDKLSMRLNIPTYVTTDINGNVYIADTIANVIYKITISDNQMDNVAGNGNTGAGQDNIAARSSALNRPRAVLVDNLLNIYIADSGNNKIRFVNHITGFITTIINSSGAPGYQDGPAATALLRDPREMIFDSNGNLYFVDFGNNCIRFYNKTTQIVSTFLKREDLIGNPTSITINPKNNDIFIADSVANKIFLVKNINEVYSIINIESLLGGNYTNNSMIAYNSLLYYPLKNPNCVFFDSKTDQLLIADTGNNKIRSFEIYNEYIIETANKCATPCNFTKPVTDYMSISQGEHILKLHGKCADQDAESFNIVSNTRRVPLIGS